MGFVKDGSPEVVPVHYNESWRLTINYSQGNWLQVRLVKDKLTWKVYDVYSQGTQGFAKAAENFIAQTLSEALKLAVEQESCALELEEIEF